MFAATNPTMLLVARPADQGGTFFLYIYKIHQTAYHPRRTNKQTETTRIDILVFLSFVFI